jgi:hypothetical protein
VRGLAKAPSAGSTSSQGNGLGSLIRGAFAILGVPSRAKGSGALSRRPGRLLLLGFALLVLTASMASPAFAAKTHPYTGTSFGPDGVGGSASFANLMSIAVDHASGNVFAYDAGDGGKIYKFDSAGAPLNFSGLSGNAIEDVGGTSSTGAEFQIAVAPPGSPGGTAGDIYVAGGGSPSLRVFSPAGLPLGDILLGELEFAGEPCGVAVSPAGHVFVGIYADQSEVREFVPTANPPTPADESPTRSSGVVGLGHGICNVAADGAGNVYAAGYESGPIYKLEGLADPTATIVDLAATTLAVDPTDNDLFANRRSEFAQYDSAGNLIGISGAGQLSISRGIAVNGDGETVYAGNGGSGKIDVFGPTIVVPGVTLEAASGVTSIKATLHANINSAGLAVEECVFEYGTTTAYGGSKPCEGPLPTDEADHPVSAALTGLTPSTEYHFRIRATNANGANRSADRTFTTTQPAITGEATAIAGTKATLNGVVLPGGEAVTDCKFEYGKSKSLGQSVPCQGAIPTDEGEHPVSAALSGLATGTTYFFRIAVTNANGTARGKTLSFFTTQPAITGEATAIAGTKATLNGVVLPEGEAVIDCVFEYGRLDALGYGSTVPCEGAVPTDEGEHAVTAQLSQLAPNDMGYRFRLVIARAGGTSRGIARSFATNATAITGGSSTVADTTATVEGSLDPEGTPYTECSFEFGTTTSYGRSAPCAESPAEIGEGTGPVSVHADLADLARGTTYRYRLVATKPAGTERGADQSFTTLGARIEAQWASSVAFTDATLQAQINPQGSPTTYHLEYGTDTSYGISTPERDVGADETAHVVTNTLKDLTAEATYHYRFVATNSVGVTEGPDLTFTLRSSLPLETDCPNQAFRTSVSGNLPDCRAYEMVSPVEKGGIGIEPSINIGGYEVGFNQAATSGDALTYTTTQGFAAPEGAPYARQYLGSRSASGWGTQSLAAGQNSSRYPAAERLDLEYRLFTPDLCTGALLNFSEPALTSAAVDDAPNIYARDTCGGGGLRGVSATPHQARPEIGGISADGRCVVYFPNLFDLGAVRTEGVTDPGGIYENCEGTVRRLDLLPDGTPAEGRAMPGTPLEQGAEQMLRFSTMDGAVSEDGSTVYWANLAQDAGDPTNDRQLFVRINAKEEQSAFGGGGECVEPAKACTLPVSLLAEPEGGEPSFAAASADGTRAYFLFRDPGNPPQSLFEYNLTTRSARLIATGLAITGGNGWPLTPVMGASEDGSRVYFWSTKALNGEGDAGQLNLYLFESDSPATGATRLVATLPYASNTRDQEYGPVARPYFRSARITPDGRHAVFTTNASLTGYVNRAVGSGNPAVEVYVYDATANGGDGELSCVSCNPTGQRPKARFIDRTVGQPSVNEFAAVIPGYYTSLQAPRVITDDGSRVFFESFDALLTQDTNGKADVYEWMAEGAGNCSDQSPLYSPVNSGCLALISSGESAADSKLIDASGSGSDVFFSTGQSLLPQDPGLTDIYDARVGGGFPPPPNPAPGCEGEACQGPLTPPNDPTPSSASFQGPGNVREKTTSRKQKKKQQQKNKHRKRGKAHKKQQRAGHNGRQGR